MEACLDPAAKDLDIYEEATHFPLVIVHNDRVGLFSRKAQHYRLSHFKNPERGVFKSTDLTHNESSYTYSLCRDGGYFFTPISGSGGALCPAIWKLNQYKSFHLLTRPLQSEFSLYELPLCRCNEKINIAQDIKDGKRFRLVVEFASQRLFSIELYMIYVFEDAIELLFPPIFTCPQEFFGLGIFEEVVENSSLERNSFSSIMDSRQGWKRIIASGLEMCVVGMFVDFDNGEFCFKWDIGGKSQMAKDKIASMKLFSF